MHPTCPFNQQYDTLKVMTLTECKIAIADAIIDFRDRNGDAGLPPNIVHLVDEYKEVVKSEEAARILDDELRKKNEERKHLKAEAEKKRLYDCLAHPVPWADKVPINERFVVMKIRNEYYQCQKLYERDDYCPIDLLRGYTAPYFGYYGSGLRHCHIEIMKDLLCLRGLELWKFVGAEFHFFRLSDKEKLTKKMSIVSYSVGDDGSVKELHVGQPLTFHEHFKALELKYGTNETKK